MSNFKKKLQTVIEREALKIIQKAIAEKTKPAKVKEEPRFKDDEVF